MGYTVFESTANSAFVAARSDTQPAENHAPVISTLTATPSTVAPLAKSTVVVAASDPDSDALSYIWTCSGGTLATGSTSVAWTAPAINGTYTVTCTAKDAGGLTASKTVSITVTSPTGGEVITIKGGTQ
jgi:hypothetical protein